MEIIYIRQTQDYIIIAKQAESGIYKIVAMERNTFYEIENHFTNRRELRKEFKKVCRNYTRIKTAV